MAIWHGETLTELPQVSSWKKGVGGRTVRTFKGNQASITAKTLELQGLKYETETTTGPVWTLVAVINVDLATNPDAEEPEPIPVWEIIPHNIEQSIFESGRKFVKGLPSTVRTAVDAKLKSPQKYSLNFVDDTVDLNTAEGKEWQNKAARIYHYKLMGADSVRTHTLTLRRSIVVSNNYSLKWSVANADKVLSG